MLKNIRMDFLYGVVSVAREIGSNGGNDLVVGIGQGPLLAQLFSRPRLVEAALAASHTQPQEVGALSSGWHGLRGVALCRPRVTTLTKWKMFTDAISIVLQWRKRS